MADISLIANSGIQFYSTQIDLSQNSDAFNVRMSFAEITKKSDVGTEEVHFDHAYRHKERDEYIEVTPIMANAPVAINKETGKIDETKLTPNSIVPIREDFVFSVRTLQALESYENNWIPIPYYRKDHFSNNIHQGPFTWARMRISRIAGTEEAESGYTHNITLAFDTRCAEYEEYLTPTQFDAEKSTFVCDYKDEGFVFCQNEWVLDWLRNCFNENNADKKKKDDLSYPFVANYYVLLKCLQLARWKYKDTKAEGFPSVNLYSNNLTVEVDLILDIGNSRTCGILLETSNIDQKFDFNTKAVPLAIRDLSMPEKTYSDPFDMHIAFVKPDFGPDITISGNSDAFKWPSLMRVGKEASRLAVIHAGKAANATMSSPKRYLWDTDKRDFPWQFVPDSRDPFAKPAIFGISDYFTETGEYLEKAVLTAKRKGTTMPVLAFNPFYSRSTLMAFALAEIFVQAATFVNSYEFRLRQGREFLPRKLKRIVLTTPTAMLLQEKVIMRERAEEALGALKKFYKDMSNSMDQSFIDTELTIIPASKEVKNMAQFSKADAKTSTDDLPKEWGYDEATCSQLTFVYSEISDRFMMNANLYLNTVGKFRTDVANTSQPAVTIASIDIGGGTSDLMIGTYQADPQAKARLIVQPMFWEGFNLAGDNIVKRVIEQVVLPGIRVEAEKLGCTNASDAMDFLFGKYSARVEAKDRVMRRQFAMQVALPIAYGVLQHAADNHQPEHKSFDSFFVDYEHPRPQIVNYINNEFRKHGAVNFDLTKMSWYLDADGINKVVRAVVEKMIKDLCGIIAQYQCDYVLLSGRPTNLPVVRDIFVKFLPTTPDRIVSMGRYRIGHWYPFAKEKGVINDPKTCVSVGAAVALMGGTLGWLPDFSIDTRFLRSVNSTADFIGEYDKEKARISKVFIPRNKDMAKITFFRSLLIGMRQMPVEDWIGTPMYNLVYATNEAKTEYVNKEPLTIEIQREWREDKETILPLETITDANGDEVPAKKLKLKLQSLADEHGYWLDTGIFVIDFLGDYRNI